MTHEYRGKYATKHDKDQPIDEEVKKLVLEKIVDDRITCSAAHEVATTAHVSPAEVGIVIDMVNARLTHCILGLYGYPDGKPVKKAPAKEDKELLKAITDAASDKHLACKDAWDIADRLKVGRLTVSRMAEAHGIKVHKCQLGAF